ncbi:MAG TPA: isoprenylcysteine carboxylmethyltransferase family protein [Opitutaceae bacterium]|nr:isoprenylcysteine carboxylmethyltransferase family protein [Opitutaceae bacterium]
MSKSPPAGSRNPVRLLLFVPVPWVFILCYLLGIGLEYAWPSNRGAQPSPAGWSIAGGALLAVGAVFAGWSLWIFFRSRTTTVPGRKSTRLVTWGPYRFSRNPMYVSLTLAYLGEAALLRQLGPALLLPLTLAYLQWIVIPLEESRLVEVFAGEYEQYRARVRRWL